MKYILGKKIEMSQVYNEQGEVVPVTLVQAGPCTITQIRNDKSGRKKIQIGYGSKRKISKPLQGHLKGMDNFRLLKEFFFVDEKEVVKGEKIDVSVFKPGEKVDVSGVSKGKGFQGVVKRHGFHGSPASHGHKDQLRMPGSIGATDAARVFPGKRMPGRMGTDSTTIKNLEIVQVDPEKNILMIKGALPGARNSMIIVISQQEWESIKQPEPIKQDKELEGKIEEIEVKKSEPVKEEKNIEEKLPKKE